MNAGTAIEILRRFGTADLSTTLARIESSAVGMGQTDCVDLLQTFQATHETLAAAATIKEVIGQINVVIHALGIMLCLPQIIEADEQIQYVSLGAGNTGRRFDLETNRRVAEFKFIRWQGGPEAIRQNSLFKDFFGLAEYDTDKRRVLYLLGTAHAMRFFSGRRSLNSVLYTSALKQRFYERYAGKYATVSDYYMPRKDLVEITDVSSFVPQLINALKA